MPRKTKVNPSILYSCVVDSKQSKVLQVLAVYLGWKWNSMDSDVNDGIDIYEPTKTNGDVMSRYRLYFYSKKKVMGWDYANAEARKEELRMNFGEMVKLFSEEIIKE